MALWHQQLWTIMGYVSPEEADMLHKQTDELDEADLQIFLQRTWGALLARDSVQAFVIAANLRLADNSWYTQTLEQLSAEDVEVIFKERIRDIRPDVQNDVINNFQNLGFYEQVLDFSHSEGWHNRESVKHERFNSVFEQFVQDFPADAFIYACQKPGWVQDIHGVQKARVRLEECLRGSRDDAYEILEVYNRCDGSKYYFAESELKHILTEEALRTFPLRAELYQLCLENDDSFYWEIGKSMLDDETIEAFPEEARVLAYEAGEEELAEDIHGGSLVPEYASLVSEAKRIVDSVGKQYQVDLPQKIVLGGPKGSYASIRTKRLGSPEKAEEELTTDGIGA